jgi:predicted porin
MKKLLIATAALAMVTGTAQAQSSVTVYGNIDVGYSTLDVTTSGVKSGIDNIGNSNDSSSRFGLRGSEDLGGGLKANFALETGLGSFTAATTGVAGATTPQPTSLGDRAQWIELESKSGAVRLGRQDTASRTIVNSYDAGGATNVIGNLAAKDALLAGRFHGASLTSARMSGLQVGGQFYQNTQSEDAKDDVKANGYALSANYVAGKFSAHAAMTDLKTTIRAVTAAAAVVPDADNNAVAAKDTVTAGNIDLKTTAIGAAYDFGVAKLMASYAKVDQVDNKETTNGSNRYIQRDYTSVGVQVPMGKTTGFAQYSKGSALAGKGGTVPAANAATGVFNANASGYDGDVVGYTIGARYAFSKRTYGYAIYGADEVDTAATTSTKRDQIAFGINHAF